MSLHFDGQLNLWLLDLNSEASRTAEEIRYIELGGDLPSVALTRIWWSDTRVYNDLQPFSVAELIKPSLFADLGPEDTT